jgi:stage II sporulation protein P
MVNVTVVKGKDVIKYLVRIMVVMILIFILARYFCSLKETTMATEIKDKEDSSYISCLEETIQVAKQIKQQENKETKENSKINSKEPVKAILSRELGFIDSITKNDATVIKLGNEESSITFENNESKENSENSQEIQKAEENVQTEVVKNNVPNKYTNTYNNVQIKNETGITITNDMLNYDLSINTNNVMIFHTHTCESYTSSEKNKYDQSSSFRTTDLNFTVSKVGDELTNQLKSYGYNVIHDKTYHDYPAYSGSYGRSLTTVQNLLKANSNTDVIFDIHRDAIGDSSYAPKVKIGDEYAAQLMFVIGTNESGLYHPNWIQNLKFAIKVQEKANELYPGLFKPIVVRSSRYNQHVSKCASIIEVGATGNTLEEANTSMKYLSKVLSEVLK